MSETVATASVLLTNEVGLHARPSVKLTQLAKSFNANVAVAATPEGPWIDAKSPVKIMRVRLARGARLHVRAEGKDAEAAVGAVVALIESGFGEHG
jgi:phosphocarrier protein